MLERVPVDLHGHDIDEKLRASAPALVPYQGSEIEIRAIRGDRVSLARGASVSYRDLLADLTREAAAPHRDAINRLLDVCAVEPARRERAFQTLLRQRVRNQRIATIHLLRTPPGASFPAQLRQAGVPLRLGVLLAAHAAVYALWIASWTQLERSPALWAALLLAMIPLRMLDTWWQGVVAVRAGSLLRRRLLAGALKLEPDEVRHEGAGHFLGRAIESEWIESLALGGGMTSALALVEIVMALAVMARGATPLAQSALLVVWIALAAAVARGYWKARLDWTAARLRLTHDLIENMTGHRTRAVQQPPAEWHAEERQALEHYHALSSRMDRRGVLLSSFIPRGWLLASLGLLAVSGGSTRLVISAGAALLAWHAFRRLAAGLAQLAGAAISWRQVKTMFNAAARPAPPEPQPCATPDEVAAAQAVSFRYSAHAGPVLDSASLAVRKSDWVLLEGPSGGGKSTLVALLTGLRAPSSGAIRRTGAAASAPQYHDNHLLTGTFAYNLLMGRRWPPTVADFEEAETVARELGLGPLIGRMPAGMLQMVGETGWQLSQGERSRVFLARALLQSAELVILDESFAALDPENLQRSLECAMRRAKTLLVVAHP